MIRRETQHGWLLISQLEHARLAHSLARAWGNANVPGLPLVDWLLPAIRDHDDGWFEWEQSPTRNADGLPRSFTEMAAADSVEIWSRSIEICASGPPSFSEALRRLRASGNDVTREEALAIEDLLEGGRRFRRDEFLVELAQHVEITEEIAVATIEKFEQHGLIRPCGRALGQEFYEIGLPPIGEAPLAGLWVSEHFQALARQSMEQRDDEDPDLERLEEFLDDQENHCGTWRQAAAEFAGEELDRVINSGLRYLQFFDRISLWLCMAERHEPWRIDLSDERSFEFRPESGRILQVSPWPFSDGALELSVTAFDGKRNTAVPWQLNPGPNDQKTPRISSEYEPEA